MKVSTGAGITGLGEVDSSPLAAKAVIEGPFSHTISTGLKHLLIGEAPFETERRWHTMYQRTIYLKWSPMRARTASLQASSLAWLQATRTAKSFPTASHALAIHMVLLPL